MTDRTIFVRPKGGLTVPKPDGTHLDPAGETVPATSWWRRREAEGAVEIAEAPPPPAAASTGAADVSAAATAPAEGASKTVRKGS